MLGGDAAQKNVVVSVDKYCPIMCTPLESKKNLLGIMGM